MSDEANSIQEQLEPGDSSSKADEMQKPAESSPETMIPELNIYPASSASSQELPEFPPSMLPYFLSLLNPQPPPMAERPELWHPDSVPLTGHTRHCLHLFKAHIERLLRKRPPSADVFPDENNATVLELLLYGTPGTPYEGGFFHFTVRATPDYPKQAPRVAFQTRSATSNRVRFNPNFYENGFVCVGILGTWGENTWQKEFRLENVLHVLQHCLNAEPLANEPDWNPQGTEERTAQMQQYNDQMSFETLRVAVCEQLERRSLPPELHKRAAAYFVQHYQAYRDRCSQLRQRLDGLPIYDFYHPRASPNEVYDFAAVYRRMERLLPRAQRDSEAK